MIFVFVILCLVVSPKIVCGNPAASHEKNLFDSFLKAVNTYSEQLDKSIDWTVIDRTIQNLRNNKGLFSSASGVLVADVVVNTNGAKDKYFGASREVFHWCRASKSYINAYVLICRKINEVVALPDAIESTQRVLLNKILDDGLIKMKAGISKIEEAKEFLSKARGKLTELEISVENDGQRKIQEIEDRIAGSRSDSMNVLQANLIGGIISLLVTELHTVPQIKESLNSTRDAFGAFGQQIDGAVSAINVAREVMTTEITRITELQASTESTKTFLNLDLLIVQAILDSATELLGQCDAFVLRHGNLKL